tara:strand:- start:85636 stop:86001 length:366 start_codon:yes stop_codon:yes gene_type:complete
LAKRAECATEVKNIDQFQTPISKAKKRPHRARLFRIDGFIEAEDLVNLNQINKKGIANSALKNAVEVGETELNLTNIAEAPKRIAPKEIKTRPTKYCLGFMGADVIYLVILNSNNYEQNNS